MTTRHTESKITTTTIDEQPAPVAASAAAAAGAAVPALLLSDPDNVANTCFQSSSTGSSQPRLSGRRRPSTKPIPQFPALFFPAKTAAKTMIIITSATTPPMISCYKADGHMCQPCRAPDNTAGYSIVIHALRTRRRTESRLHLHVVPPHLLPQVAAALGEVVRLHLHDAHTAAISHIGGAHGALSTWLGLESGGKERV